MNYEDKISVFKETFSTLIGEKYPIIYIGTQEIIDTPKGERGYNLAEQIKTQSPEIYNAVLQDYKIDPNSLAEGEHPEFFDRMAGNLARNNSAAVLKVDGNCIVALPSKDFDEKHEILANLNGDVELLNRFNFDAFNYSAEDLLRWVAAHEAGHVLFGSSITMASSFRERLESEVKADELANDYMESVGVKGIDEGIGSVRALSTLLYGKGEGSLEDEHSTATLTGRNLHDRDILEIRQVRSLIEDAVSSRIGGSFNSLLMEAPDRIAEIVRQELVTNNPRGLSETLVEKIEATAHAIDNYLLPAFDFERPPSFNIDEFYEIKPFEGAQLQDFDASDLDMSTSLVAMKGDQNIEAEQERDANASLELKLKSQDISIS